MSQKLISKMLSGKEVYSDIAAVQAWDGAQTLLKQADWITRAIRNAMSPMLDRT